MLPGKHYIAITDRYSGWLDAYVASRPDKTRDTMRHFARFFADHGIPKRVFSDGGLNFASREMRDFLQEWGIAHRMSSAHYPQSNGLAESGVKAIKRLLQKTGGKMDMEYYAGLLELRNTPRAGGKSPAELVTQKPMRSRVPMHETAQHPENLISKDEHDDKTRHIANEAKKRYDMSSKCLRELHKGQKVLGGVPRRQAGHEEQTTPQTHARALQVQ